MAVRRVIVAVAVAITVGAAACAPSPSIEGFDDGPDPTTTTPAPTVTPSPERDADDAPALDPAEFASVPGHIVTHDGNVTIHAGDDAIDLETGPVPGQPTWARDGSRLVTVSGDGRAPMLDIFDAAGEPLNQVPAERLYFFFSWSYDGTRIAALGPGAGGTTLDILDAGGAVLHADVAAAGSLFLAWEPDALRLVAHADDELLRIDADGTTIGLGRVGSDFFAPKWIPGSSDIILVVDIEGTSTLVRRGVEEGDSLTTLGQVASEAGIAVTPDGRLAAISMSFPDNSGAGAQTTGVLRQSRFPQTVQSFTGTVEIVDLATAERVLILEGLPLWTEWNADGSRLLVAISDDRTGETTWWIYETAPFDETAEVYAVTRFIAAPIFYGSYLIFADQFIEQPRLWAPTGDAFVFAESTPRGSMIRIVAAEEDAEPALIGPGEVGFWSPSASTP